MCVQRNDIKFTKMLVKANADLNIRDRSPSRGLGDVYKRQRHKLLHSLAAYKVALKQFSSL